VLNKGHFAHFAQNRLPWQCPLTNRTKRPDQENSCKYLSCGEKIVKIGPVDAEIFSVDLKIEEISVGKIYSPVGKFAERAK